MTSTSVYRARRVGAGRVGTRGGYTGGYWGGAIPGYYPAAAKRRPRQRSGPRKPQGAGVGGLGCSAHGVVFGGGVGLLYHPSGPVGPCRPSLYRTPWNAASGPIRARFHLIFLKVSQNRGVSPKSTEKACHSPCLQNGLKNSPLEIPRFPISLAFSHKELMVPFMT